MRGPNSRRSGRPPPLAPAGPHSRQSNHRERWSAPWHDVQPAPWSVVATSVSVRPHFGDRPARMGDPERTHTHTTNPPDDTRVGYTRESMKCRSYGACVRVLGRRVLWLASPSSDVVVCSRLQRSASPPRRPTVGHTHPATSLTHSRCLSFARCSALLQVGPAHSDHRGPTRVTCDLRRL